MGTRWKPIDLAVKLKLACLMNTRLLETEHALLEDICQFSVVKGVRGSQKHSQFVGIFILKNNCLRNQFSLLTFLNFASKENFC